MKNLSLAKVLRIKTSRQPKWNFFSEKKDRPRAEILERANEHREAVKPYCLISYRERLGASL